MFRLRRNVLTLGQFWRSSSGAGSTAQAAGSEDFDIVNSPKTRPLRYTGMAALTT